MIKTPSFMEEMSAPITLKWRVLGFLLIITSFITISGIITYNITQSNSDFSAGVNISGRQRMLSQRIALLSDLTFQHDIIDIEHDSPAHDDSLTIEPVRTALLAELRKSIQLMEISHYALLEGSAEMGLPEPPESYRAFYFSDESALHQDILDYLRLAKNILGNAESLEGGTPLTNEEKLTLKNDINRLHTKALYETLPLIDRSVSIYEEETKKAQQQLTHIIYILLAGIIFLLVLLWLYGFYPLQKRIVHQFSTLKRQKNESKENELRLDLALKGTAIGVWDWDIPNSTFYWSPVMYELLGLDHEEGFIPTIDYFQGILMPRDKEKFNSAMQKHLKHGDPFEVEVRLNHTEKPYIWTRIRGQAMWGDDYRAYRMLGSIEDVTELKQINIQTNTFIQGIEAANIAFAIVNLNDEQRRFTYASPAFCALTKCPSEKITSSNMNMFTGPETSMISLDQIDYAFNMGESHALKVLNYKLDGTTFWNEVILRPIQVDGEDKPHSYIILFNDLTDSLRKEKQEASRQRTESLGALAGSVAHEINNLLMPMTMAKDILEDALKDDCDPFAREQLDTMVAYANQAKTIVEGILTFSRKETKNLENVAIYEELENSIRFIRGLLSNNTELVLQEPQNDEIKELKSLINTTELKQIITNLCKNAEDAFKDQNGTITLSIDKRRLSNQEKTKLELFANDFIVIGVQDNGSGIPQEVMDKIFDPLFTTKEIGRGTGLGLSVVVGILRSWGGCITVKSTLGKGSTFEIFIPTQKTVDDYNDLSDLAETLDDFDLGTFFES